MDTQCKRASARAHLRTQTVRYPNLSIQLLVKSLSLRLFRRKLFPYIFFPPPSFSLRSPATRVPFFLFSCNYFFFSTIHRSIDRINFSFVLPSKDRKSRGRRFRGGEVSFFFSSFPLSSPSVYIFRFQRDIVDVVLVLFLARTMGTR